MLVTHALLGFAGTLMGLPLSLIMTHYSSVIPVPHGSPPGQTRIPEGWSQRQGQDSDPVDGRPVKRHRVTRKVPADNRLHEPSG